MRRKGPGMRSVVALTYISTVLLVVICVMFFFLRTYQQSLLQNVYTSSRQTVSQMSNTVSNYIADMDDLMELLQTQLKDPSLDRDGFLKTLLQIHPDIVAVTTYNEKGDLLDCQALYHEIRKDLYKNLSFDLEKAQNSDSGYISTPHVVTLFDSYYPWVVTMVGALDSQNEEKWIALDISFSDISTYINNVGNGQHGYCFLMDSGGNMIYHPQQQLLYFNIKQENVDKIASLEDGTYLQDNVIYTVQSLKNSQWRAVGVSYVDEVITSSVNNAARILVFTVVFLLVVVVVFSIYLSMMLSNPIHGLMTAMGSFERDADNFTYTPVGGVREIRALSDSFGQMVIKIQRLMDTVRSEEINLRKTELKALQAQINPHFLYNTLDSIAWMCEQKRNDEAVQMVKALAQLFRISISSGHELIPIRKELEHAKSYLQIQTHRYKNQFSYTFSVEEDCLEYLCNKITLQPMIENAIYHGINGLVDEGLIHISVGSDGDDIVFTVEDNGVGMTQEQVAAILRKKRSDRAGIGVKNVNDRLKIYFGNQYGITIQSVPDEGTRVTIRMPKVREEAEYENR